MKKTTVKKSLRKWLVAAAGILIFSSGWLTAAELLVVKLNPPDLKRGLPLMEALAVRASAREYSEKDLSLQDLSDLLWAADGMSRPAENKSTAPSAMNAHDIRIYVFMKDGAYLYDSPKHELLPVLAGDYRSQLMMARPPRPAASPVPATAVPAGTTPPAPPVAAAPASPLSPPLPPSKPPVQIVLVSDGDRFTRGDPARKLEWGALDAGIVSQNISLFCAATGLKTVPRAAIDKDKIKYLLKLADTMNVFLNHPIGYAK
jgi:nitroreductase